MTLRAADRVSRPAVAALWFFAAVLIAGDVAHRLMAQAAGVDFLGDLVLLTAGVFALVLACIGGLRMLSGRLGQRAMARVLGLPLRDFAFSATFAMISAPAVWLSL